LLTVGQMRKLLRNITYRPGWTITVREGRFEGPHLTVHAQVENSYRPGETTVLDIHSPIPPMTTAAQFDAFLAWRLGRIECHEMREWLQRDGKPIFDPHAPLADQDR
jgi:hypothetical protein